MDLDEIIDHPLTALGALATSATAILQPGALEAALGALWATAGTLFTALSIGAFTLPRIFPAIEPAVPILKGLFAGALVLYGMKLLAGVYQEFDNRL
jgi:hypothetical protein